MMTKKKDEGKEEEPKELTKQDKLKSLLKTLKASKQLEGANIFLASDERAQLKTISFGVPALDELCGGQLRGGYTILYGAEKAGKSTLMLRALAQMQREGLDPVLLDLEERFDPEWAKVQGVDIDNLYVVSGAMDLEEALTIVEVGVRDGLFTGVAVDSVQAKAPRGEIQDKKGKARNLDSDTMALMARLLSKWFRRMGTLTKSKQIPVLLLSQVRTSGLSVGGYLDITGGLALKHYASTVIYVGRTDKIAMTKQGEKIELGYWMKAVLKKTSLCANEGKETRIPVYFGVGIEDSAAAVRSGMNLGIVTNLTRGVEFNDKKYPSEAAFVEKLRASAALRGDLHQAIATLTGDAIDDLGSDVDDGLPAIDDEILPTVLPDVLHNDNASGKGKNIVGNEGNACAPCNKEFKSNAGLKTHIKRMH